jgi:N-acetylglucosamine repressor
LGIGIGTPGLIDTLNGVVLRAVNLSWQDLPLGPVLSERVGLPVYLANDSQVTALAEHVFGDCEDAGNLVVIKFGRGVGSGIVLNHVLYQGEGFGAGEIGHWQVVDNGLPCRCGNHGCLETVASSSAMVAQAQERLRAGAASSMSQFAPRPEDLTFDVLLRAYREGDALALDLGLQAARALGAAIAAMVSVLNVRHILLAGDVAGLGADWLANVRQAMRRRALSALVDQAEIGLSCLGANHVLLGASALLLTHALGLGFDRYPAFARVE